MNILRVLACLILCLSMHLSAATAKDMLGNWTVDGPATWERMKAMPQLAAAPAPQQEQMKAMILGMAAGMTYEVTADKLIGKMGEKTDIDAYKVLGVDGDLIHTETTNGKGEVEKTDIQVGKDTLTLISLDKPGMVMVLKKAVAAAPAPAK
jgi:hypothetical protein